MQRVKNSQVKKERNKSLLNHVGQPGLESGLQATHAAKIRVKSIPSTATLKKNIHSDNFNRSFFPKVPIRRFATKSRGLRYVAKQRGVTIRDPRVVHVDVRGICVLAHQL